MAKYGLRNHLPLRVHSLNVKSRATALLTCGLQRLAADCQSTRAAHYVLSLANRMTDVAFLARHEFERIVN